MLQFIFMFYGRFIWNVFFFFYILGEGGGLRWGNSNWNWGSSSNRSEIQVWCLGSEFARNLKFDEHSHRLKHIFKENIQILVFCKQPVFLCSKISWSPAMNLDTGRIFSPQNYDIYSNVMSPVKYNSQSIPSWLDSHRHFQFNTAINKVVFCHHMNSHE